MFVHMYIVRMKRLQRIKKRCSYYNARLTAQRGVSVFAVVERSWYLVKKTWTDYYVVAKLRQPNRHPMSLLVKW